MHGGEKETDGSVNTAVGHFFQVARLAGLEPATPGSEAQCSIH